MVYLKKATIEDCGRIHRLQVESFRLLLDSYHDLETNPGAEPLSRVTERMQQTDSAYYFIMLSGIEIGAVRIRVVSKSICRVGPIFILPEYQGRGYAQQAMLLAEERYPTIHIWQLDTILQEQKLCYLYEKLGYRKTGEQENIQPGMDIVFYEKRR